MTNMKKYFGKSCISWNFASPQGETWGKAIFFKKKLTLTLTTLTFITLLISVSLAQHQHRDKHVSHSPLSPSPHYCLQTLLLSITTGRDMRQSYFFKRKMYTHTHHSQLHHTIVFSLSYWPSPRRQTCGRAHKTHIHTHRSHPHHTIVFGLSCWASPQGQTCVTADKTHTHTHHCHRHHTIVSCWTSPQGQNMSKLRKLTLTLTALTLATLLSSDSPAEQHHRDKPVSQLNAGLTGVTLAFLITFSLHTTRYNLSSKLKE